MSFRSFSADSCSCFSFNFLRAFFPNFGVSSAFEGVAAAAGAGVAGAYALAADLEGVFFGACFWGVFIADWSFCAGTTVFFAGVILASFFAGDSETFLTDCGFTLACYAAYLTALAASATSSFSFCFCFCLSICFFNLLALFLFMVESIRLCFSFDTAVIKG